MLVLKRLFGARISLRAERLTYFVGLRVPVRVPDLGHGSTSPALGGAARDRRMALRRARSAVGAPGRTDPSSTVSVDVGGVLVGSAHPDRRPVDDQHRHGRCRRDRDPGRAARARRLAAGAGHGQHRRGRGARCRRWSASSAASAWTCRSSATSTTTATSCSPSTRRWRPRLAKYRINPGNVGAQAPRRELPDDRPGRDRQRQAGPDRRELGLARPGAPDRADGRERPSAEPRDARDVMIEAMIESALRSAELAEETGLRHDRIILSAKVSRRARPRRRLPPASPRAPTTRSTSG